MPRNSTEPKALTRKLPPTKAALDPDWSWIKRHYRAGLKSTREIARESTAKGRKISHVAIEKRADKEGWTRDLKARVKAAIADELARDAVNKPGKPVTSDVPDEEIIEAAARQGADVVRSHRNDVAQLRRLTVGLATELERASEVHEDLAQAIVAGTTPPADATKAQIETAMQRRERLMRVIGLDRRATIVKDLSQAMGKQIALERQAFNLNEGEAPDSIEDRLASLDE